MWVLPGLSALWFPWFVLLIEALQGPLPIHPLSAHPGGEASPLRAHPGFRASVFPVEALPTVSPTMPPEAGAEAEVAVLIPLHLCGLFYHVQGASWMPPLGMAVVRVLSSADSHWLLGLPSASPGREA